MDRICWAVFLEPAQFKQRAREPSGSVHSSTATAAHTHLQPHDTTLLILIIWIWCWAGRWEPPLTYLSPSDLVVFSYLSLCLLRSLSAPQKSRWTPAEWRSSSHFGQRMVRRREKSLRYILMLEKNLINWKLHARRSLKNISLHLYFPSGVSQDAEEVDLEMLAPYISMDDDFQLTFLSSLSEQEDKTSAPPSTLSTAPTASKKRYHRISIQSQIRWLMIYFRRGLRGNMHAVNMATWQTAHLRLCSSRSHHPDEEVVSSLLSQPKRQKKEASCIEEELLSYAYHLVSERGKEERAKLGQNWKN